jgi:NADH:quinone reductase (non-electrogenic)
MQIRAAHEQERTNVPTEDVLARKPQIVIVGGGFGGLQAAKKLEHQPVDVTIIDHNNFHLFQPMLYQVATGGLSPADISIPLREIFHKQKNTRILMAEVTGIDAQEQLVRLEDGQTIDYDYLIIATGAGSNYFGHQEWQSLAPGMKSLTDALTIRRMVLSAFEAAERAQDEDTRKALLTFVLVGGGPTGVELAGAIAELARESLEGDFHSIDPSTANIILVQGPKRILPQFSASLARAATKQLRRMGVRIRLGVHVKDVKSTGVMIGDEYLAAENVIWTAGVKASPAAKWLHTDTDHDGRIKVQQDLSVPGHPAIFVIGDTAYLEQKGKPLPGLAPVAMQEATYATSVILERIAGKDAQKPFHYVSKGTMAMVGRSFGLVEIGPLRFSGFFAWLTWIFIHILLLINFRNRILTLIQYAWNYFTCQRGSRVILPDNTVRSPKNAC